MFTPNDDVSIERLPWVTWSLAAVWTTAWLASVFGLDPASAGLGLDPSAPSVQGFAAHWVFQSSFFHWLVTTSLLLAFGPHLEEAWGKAAYGPLLVASVLVAATAHAFLGPDERPLVGGSAAVAAIIAAVIIRYGLGSLPTYLVTSFSQPPTTSFDIPALAGVGVWFAGEVMMTVTSSGIGLTHGVGPMVPLCGALVGGGFAMMLRDAGPPVTAAAPRGHNALAMAQAAREAGRPHQALSALEPAVRNSPHDTELVRALCDAACEAGEAQRATEPMRKLIVEHVRKGEASAAAAFWRAFGDKVPGVRLDPRTAVDLAAALAAATEKKLAARVLRDTLASTPRLSPGIAMRMCEVAAPLHRETAIKAGRMALAAEGLDDAKKAKLEARLAQLEAQAPDDDAELEAEAPPARPAARPATRSAAHSAEPAAPARPLDRTLDLDLDPDYAPIRPKDLPPPPPEMVFELSADGEKTAGDSKPDYLSAPLPDTEPIINEVGADGAAAGVAPMLTMPEPDAREELAAAVAADQPRFHELKCVEAVPTVLDVDGLALKNGPHVDLARVDAIGVGAIQGMAAKPVLLIDLLLNWSELGEAPLRTIRLRSDHFDPRALFPNSKGGLDAFRALVEELLARTGATPLPDSETCRGKPFKMYPQLAQYEREVLQVER